MVPGAWWHATHANAKEIADAARTGAVIGLCPSTEADLGDGLFDFPACQEACGAFGIGSDSNVMLDAFAELRLLDYGQRLRASGAMWRPAITAIADGRCGNRRRAEGRLPAGARRGVLPRGSRRISW